MYIICYIHKKQTLTAFANTAAVAFANGISSVAPRLNYVHMPVPRRRKDSEYFKPLEKLRLPSPARLILGLVHYTDGVGGTRDRMAAANEFVATYDIATECGFGRRDPATIPDLLKIHKELCA